MKERQKFFIDYEDNTLLIGFLIERRDHLPQKTRKERKKNATSCLSIDDQILTLLTGAYPLEIPKRKKKDHSLGYCMP